MMNTPVMRMIQVASLAASFALLGLTPAANADSADDQYLADLAAMNINTANPGPLIAAGHAQCDALGNPFATMGAWGQWAAAGVGPGQTNQAATAAGRAYCPDKMQSLGLPY